MLHIRISLCIKFNLMYLSLCIFVSSNFEFLDEICPRKIFMVKNRKIEHHHWIPLIQISLGTKFQLKLTILIFWPDLPKKGFSGLKQKKWRPHIFYIILHIQISLLRNFSSNWRFLFFGSNLHKKVYPVKNRNWTSPWNSAYLN